MKTRLEKAFDNYISNYDMNVKQIRFKYHHSYRVKELMKKLALDLNLSKKEIELAEVIGLLHDIGRFEQIKKYGDCSDVKTGIDHADESCIYLFDEGHIKDFYDDEKYYEIIKDAIKNHNKYIIDKKLSGKSLLFTKMIRDTDKIDIYRVISEEYTYTYDTKEISKEVLDTFNKKKTIDTHLRKSKTDTIYTYFAFIYEINFKESYKILKNGKYLEKLIPIITPTEDSVEEFEKLKEKVLNYVNKKAA